MAIVHDLTDFSKLASNITSFSHAYLLKVNDLSEGYKYALEFAKIIICENIERDDEKSIAEHQIIKNEYDDLYVVNPQSITINADEINKLLNYMETKSLHENGRRVYIIYGFERLSREVSNKILKFLEEPNDNIYGILLTKDVDKILPTIVSRCQTITLNFDLMSDDTEIIKKMSNFFEKILLKKEKMIAYNYEQFGENLLNREIMYSYFDVLEKILSYNIEAKFNVISDDNSYFCPFLQQYDIDLLIVFLKKTNYLKSLIKSNNNLSLMLDRYIIEVAREL